MSKQATKVKIVSEPESKTRSEWAAEIVVAYKQSIESILKIGNTLIAAKDALDHGQFLEMIEHDLPFEASTAERLMKIARDPRITKAAHVQLLPMAWSTLYELTKVENAVFEQAVSSGGINPKMTRTEAVQLAAPSRKKVSNRKVRVNVERETVRDAPSRPRDEPTIIIKPSEEGEDGVFFRRVVQAKACACYTGDVTNEVIELARSVAEAWNELATKLEEQRSSLLQQV